MGSDAFVLLWNRYSDGRIVRISRCHPGALVEAVLVNSGTKYRVDCGGGGVARLRAGMIAPLWNRYSDGRIVRISRCHPRALVEAVLVNSGMKYRVDCGGGGVARLRWSSTIIANQRHGVKREGSLAGRTKKRKQNEGCNTRTSQEVTHPSTTLAQAHLSAKF
ncbi:hypothetical protein DKX38_030183 [Salix brachista]|uniref:Uncharacterized protein n=1 Tax=Salix brachista TaxID=2182728 RepID=A0A5N5IUQ7_9ROSI|nr:hypothetical protein DKX38_030183 [Salix brachista]